MTAALLCLAAAGWIAARLLRPLAFSSGPAWRRLLCRAGVPIGLCVGLMPLSPAAALASGGACLIAGGFAARSPAVLRREVLHLVAAADAGTARAPFPEIAARVLLERFSRAGMQPAEAAVLAGRCLTPDDLGAQIALRERGMGAYASYLRRFGRLGETADADAAARGDRFPGGGMGRV